MDAEEQTIPALLIHPSNNNNNPNNSFFLFVLLSCSCFFQSFQLYQALQRSHPLLPGWIQRIGKERTRGEETHCEVQRWILSPGHLLPYQRWRCVSAKQSNEEGVSIDVQNTPGSAGWRASAVCILLAYYWELCTIHCYEISQTDAQYFLETA